MTVLVRGADAHVWERYEREYLLSRCTKCGWGWKVGYDNDFPCPGKPPAEDRCTKVYRGGPVYEVGPTLRCGKPEGHNGEHGPTR